MSTLQQAQLPKSRAWQYQRPRLHRSLFRQYALLFLHAFVRKCGWGALSFMREQYSSLASTLIKSSRQATMCGAGCKDVRAN